MDAPTVHWWRHAMDSQREFLTAEEVEFLLTGDDYPFAKECVQDEIQEHANDPDFHLQVPVGLPFWG